MVRLYETLTVRKEGAVLFAEIAAPPMNLLGPELVRDLVSLIQRAEADDAVRVLVFKSADPDYFISHVDVTRIDEYRAEAAKLTGEPSIALLFRHLSASRLVTIAQIEGRVRGAGSEFVLACDMRFAARESAIFGQPSRRSVCSPAAGAAQHLTRLMGRARALEVMLSAEDYDADLAERYGWINRALPADALGGFVGSLAHRIARIPAAGHVAVKDRVNAIALAPAEDFRRDSDLFGEGVRNPEAQSRIEAAMQARLPDPRCGNGPGPPAGRPGRRLIGSVEFRDTPRSQAADQQKEAPCPRPFCTCPCPSTDSSPGPTRDRATGSATAGTACTSGRWRVATPPRERRPSGGRQRPGLRRVHVDRRGRRRPGDLRAGRRLGRRPPRRRADLHLQPPGARHRHRRSGRWSPT